MIQTIGSLVCNREISLYRAFCGRWSRRAGNFWIVQLKLVNILAYFNLYIRAFTYNIHVLLQPAASLLSIIHFHLCSKSSVEVSCMTLRSRTLCAIQKSPRKFLLRAIGYIGQYSRVQHKTVEFLQGQNRETFGGISMEILRKVVDSPNRRISTRSGVLKKSTRR